MADRQDPLRNFRYRLEIDGIDQAGFAEVADRRPLDRRRSSIARATSPSTVRKLNGLNKYGNVTLKWGITDSTELAEWHQLVVDDVPLQAARRTVVIRIQNEAGEDKAAFEVINAWPCKYDPTDLNGKGNEVAIDTLELVQRGHQAHPVSSSRSNRHGFPDRDRVHASEGISRFGRRAAQGRRHAARDRGGRNPAAQGPRACSRTPPI